MPRSVVAADLRQPGAGPSGCVSRRGLVLLRLRRKFVVGA